MAPQNKFGLVAANDSGALYSLRLSKVSVSVLVRGFVGHTIATLRYSNATSDPINVAFRLPVDVNSAVYRVTAELEGRKITATSMEKKKAEDLYSTAVAAGQIALLTREESHTADVISVTLGNMPPESDCVVEVSIVGGLLVGSDGGVQYTLPTTLNPRYCPSSHPGQDDLNVKGASPVTLVTLPYTLSVTGSVTGGHPINRVVSHSDVIDVIMADADAHAQISANYEGEIKRDHDWSFVVYYKNPYAPHVLMEQGDPTSVGIMRDQVLMINLFPELPKESYTNRNEIIFVVDRSGSMGGDRIQSARAVLQLFLKSLPQGCYFNIICFGFHHTLLFPEGSRLYNQSTLAEACALQESMEADMGGTVVLEPLRSIYSNPPKQDYSRQILLLTDGSVYNVGQVTSLVSRHSHATRVFAVGIGDGASSALVAGVALAGRGRHEMVTQRDRLQAKVMGLVQSMLQAAVQQVSVSCEVDGAPRFRLVPPAPPVIFGGQHVTTYASIPPGAQLKSVTFIGSTEGVQWSTKIQQEQMIAVHDSTLALHRLASRALMQHNILYDADDCKDEVIELSINSGVLCKYTALVAIDQDGKTILGKKPGVPPDGDFDGLMPKGYSFSPSGYAGDSNFTKRFLCKKFKRSRIIAAPLSVTEFDDISLRSAMFRTSLSLPLSHAHAITIGQSNNSVNVGIDESYDQCDSSNEFATSSFETPLTTYDAVEEKTLDLEKNKKEDLFMKIVSLQHFDGSWKTKDIATLLDVDIGSLLVLNTEGWTETIFGSFLCVSLLEIYFQNRRSEWSMLVIKAKQFLLQNLATDENKGQTNQAGKNVTVEEYLIMSRQIIEKIRVDHPNLAVFSFN